jgi:hypothetical protein
VRISILARVGAETGYVGATDQPISLNLLQTGRAIRLHSQGRKAKTRQRSERVGSQFNRGRVRAGDGTTALCQWTKPLSR